MRAFLAKDSPNHSQGDSEVVLGRLAATIMRKAWRIDQHLVCPDRQPTQRDTITANVSRKDCARVDSKVPSGCQGNESKGLIWCEETSKERDAVVVVVWWQNASWCIGDAVVLGIRKRHRLF